MCIHEPASDVTPVCISVSLSVPGLLPDAGDELLYDYGANYWTAMAHNQDLTHYVNSLVADMAELLAMVVPQAGGPAAGIGGGDGGAAAAAAAGPARGGAAPATSVRAPY